MPVTTVTVEVEFVAGTWTDVTADVDMSSGLSVTVGRSSPQQTAGMSSMSLSLRNEKGKYTPGLAVLSDGSAAPFYPNVTPRRRIRYRNSAGVRWLGFVQSWSPVLANGVLGYCQVQAVDRLDQLSRVTMQTPIAQEIMADAPVLYYPLTDAAGAAAAAEQSGHSGATLPLYGSGPALTFGDNGPGFGDGTGVKFAPASSSSGQFLAGNLSFASLSAFTLEAWVNVGTSLPSWAAVGSGNAMFPVDLSSGGGVFCTLYILNGGVTAQTQLGLVNAPTSIVDGGWHHLVATQGASTLSLYVDGVLASVTASGPNVSPATKLSIGDTMSTLSYSPSRFQGNVGQVAVYSGALTPARVAARYNAGRGWYGETVDARIARFLGYAGLGSSDRNLDTSTVTCNTYPQGGKDVLSACQDMAATEGGGSVFYVLGGLARFTNRKFRKPAAPTMTINGDSDADRGVFAPSADSQSLINSATVQRASESGTATTQTFSDSNSITANGVFTGPDVTTYTVSDGDALRLAQQVVAQNRTPGYRLPQISVDLLTATTNLYAALQTVEIGKRVRVTNLPTASAPASQVDVLVEGWTERVNQNQYLVTFDTSPADTPAAFLIGDATYGRLNTAGAQLTAAVTAAATSLSITTTSGPPFTQVAGSYPFTIQIGAEQITLTTAPASPTSPQTFTGVTRAVNGTAAGPHNASDTVTLAPAATLTL